MAAGRTFPLVPLVGAVLFPSAIAPFPMAHAAGAAAIASVGESGLVVTATTRGLSGEVHERIGCVAEVQREQLKAIDEELSRESRVRE